MKVTILGSGQLVLKILLEHNEHDFNQHTNVLYGP